MKRLYTLAACATIVAGPTASTATATSGVEPVTTTGAAALATATPPPPEWEPDPDVDVPVTRVPRDASRGSALVLTVSGGGPGTSFERFSKLACDPPRGTHPRRVRACAVLDQANGDPGNLDPDPDTTCPKVFDPVTVTANGIWRGRYVWFERTYSNTCAAHAMTDVLFDI
ncbi:hypothetical protein J5X84_10265 [Streptosporangiaceae bacterium NEAU-GS5]|nr:hypothetical protein [Streptosporangiaceae bacterium NEAU-GS5]